MSKKSEVATIESQTKALATFDYGEDAGVGFESFTRDEYTIPFITVLQALSPEIERVEGAKSGLLYNKVTGRLTTSFQFVAACRDKAYFEFVPRAQGGGFVGRHEVDSHIVNAARAASLKKVGKLLTENGNELIETFHVYGIADFGNGDIEPCVISFSSSKIKVYRAWMSRLSVCTVKAPMYAHVSTISTVKERNKRGEEYYNLSIAPAKEDTRASLIPNTDPRFLAAKALAESVVKGSAKADLAETEVAIESGTDDAF